MLTPAFWSARPWLALIIAFAGTRLIIAVLGVVGVATFLDQHAPLAVIGTQALNPEVVWQKWDAVWYERIAVHGYGFELDTLRGQAAAGFFPAFPLTVGLILRVLPAVPFFWAASIFSNILALVALALLTRHLTRSAEHTAHVILALVTAAGSFYLSLPYPESLFLLLVVLVMIASRRGQYWLAGLLCGLAFTTRAHGLALIAIPVIACWRDGQLPPARRALALAATTVLFAVPIAIYLAFLSSVQGSALAFVERQAMWSNPSPYPLRALVGLVESPLRVSAWLHGGFWALYLGVLIRSWKRLPLGEALYCLGALVISTQQLEFQGIYRYVVPLVPLALAIGDERPALRSTLIAINLVVGTIMILAFVTNNRLAV